MFMPENRALRALLWLVVIIVPGGLFLLGLLAVDAAARRHRIGQAAAESQLAEVPLSGLGGSRG